MVASHGFLRLEEVRVRDRPEVGGKAANLGEIAGMGLPVPSGFVIPTRLWQLVPFNDDKDRQRSEDPQFPAILSDILGRGFADELLTWFDELAVDLVSVRSSAVAEDSSDTSFAGIFKSLLGVRRSELVDAVIQCWISSLSPRARAYCQINNIFPENVQMAVLVQELVEPTTSGVCFTSNPLTRHPAEQMMIEAVFGFGEALASGTATPDSYSYDRNAKLILSRTVANQQTKLGLVGGRLQEVPLNPFAQDLQKLADNQIHQLAATCARIHNHFGMAQDIEFAFVDGALYFLQTRPITALQQRSA